VTDVEQRESSRWIWWLTLPFLATSGFVAAAFASGITWLFLPAILFPLAAGPILWMLALTSCTIAHPLDPDAVDVSHVPVEAAPALAA
jgi:hypothetical protein